MTAQVEYPRRPYAFAVVAILIAQDPRSRGALSRPRLAR